MAVYAIKAPGDKVSNDYIAESLRINKTSRYGWGYDNSLDLKVINNMTWDEMTEDQVEAWKRGYFLLDIKEGDWIVHINIPSWGLCTAGKVKSTYHFDKNVPTDIDDFRHCILLEDTIEFDRNDERVFPEIQSCLKLRGAWWRIYNEEKFIDSINALKTNNSIEGIKRNNINYYHLNSELQDIYKDIVKKVHVTHPGKQFEYFLETIFNNISSVINVKVNGSGFGTDYGADLIVTFKTGIVGFESESTLVVQAKSYEGIHNEDSCVTQLNSAIKKYNADYGLIITTAEPSKELLEKIEQLKEQLIKEEEHKKDKISAPQIDILYGEKLAKFILKYGAPQLLE